MKTPTPDKAQGARVMRVARVEYIADPAVTLYASAEEHFSPVAVLPCATTKQARHIVKAAKFLAMQESEQVEAIVTAMIQGAGDALGWNRKERFACRALQHGRLSAGARAVLAALYG